MKRFFTLIVGLVLGLNLYGQTDTAYITTYGGIQNDVCNQIKATTDGGYIMIGTSNSFGCGNTDFYAVKIDSLGHHEWSKSYGGTENEEGFSVTQTFDHGYAFVGFTDSYGAGGYDVFLVKTDSMGNFQWQRTYGGEDWDFGYSIQQLKDSGFIICGLTYSYGAGNGDVYVIRTNSVGDTLWTRAIGGTGYEVGNSICVENDSLYAIVGNTTSFGKGDTNVYFILMNDKGIIKKSTTYGSTHSNFGNSIRKTLDHGFVMYGATDSIKSGTPFELMIKTDSVGTMQWMQILYSPASPEVGIGKDAVQAPDGTYLTLGTNNSYGLGGYAMHVQHLNSLGQWIIGPSFGGIDDEEGNSIALAKNGNVVFAGATDSRGNTVGLNDAYFVRLKNDSIFNIANYYSFPYHQYRDTAFCTLGITDQTSFTPEVKIFPNPVSSSATILVQGAIGTKYLFNILNEGGDLILHSIPLELSAHEQFIGHFEKGNLAAGVYLYEILNKTGNVAYVGKMIVN